jgi:hypothetical protein
MLFQRLIGLGCCLGALMSAPLLSGEAIPVVLQQIAGEYRLLRDGKPYYIRGFGGTEDLEKMAQFGGNSIRTWGPPERAFLDAAHAAGLSVCVGLWVEHERHGFDYADKTAVAAQIKRHCATIDALKDHPAVLMWGIGNEVELEYTNSGVWDVVEAVAAYAKETDPNHPTMTVIAYVSEEAVHEIQARCPSIDILGSNSYGGIGALSRASLEAGWDGPYIVTEWGTDGSWEVKKTTWGAEIEPTSTAKARQRAQRLAIIAEDRARCLGGYAFYWGNKQETTATWYNFFLEDGRHTEELEILRYIWTGEPMEETIPRIGQLRINNSLATENVEVSLSSVVLAEFDLLDGATEVEAEWILKTESEDKRMGGDAEQRADVLSLDIENRGARYIEFKSPDEPGAYRLYLYLRGTGQTAATANFPFRTE